MTSPLCKMSFLKTHNDLRYTKSEVKESEETS